MVSRRTALVNQSSSRSVAYRFVDAAAALQHQLDGDFTPVWGGRAQVVAVRPREPVPAGYWPIYIKDSLDDPHELGVHLDKNGRPYANVRAGSSWTITASHELLEMLADPFGHRFVRAPDIDPSSDGHLVAYLLEVGDPCEIYSYSIGGMKVSDFVTPDYYDANAPAGTRLDHLGRLKRPLEVPRGCYLSWIDPEDGRWHQRTPDGTFIKADREVDPHRNPRDDRDLAFGGAPVTA